MIFKKNWRKLMVDKDEFYWQVCDVAHPQYPAKDVFCRILFIRSAQNPASNCSIAFNQMGYHWITSSQHPVTVTPKFVLECIHHALNAGWDPEKKLAFSLENGVEIWEMFSENASN